ncbi:hypothetical protein BC828DRAFT_372256 [Blastocladiella britannica]|nr:hypothetical protein BC828DRAFT_372256 [Blastocladiella britannica]
MAFAGSAFLDKKLVHGRIEGTVKYAFPDGTIYIGEAKDGQFHGPGTMLFSNGVRYEGIWEKGQAAKGTMKFTDGLEFAPTLAEWDYCVPPDRRFYQERIHGIQAAVGTQLTPNDGKTPIPTGTYDVADGYYDPATEKVHRYDGDVFRTPEPEEREWIIKTCYYETGKHLSEQQLRTQSV